MIETILKRGDVLNFLNELLTDSRFIHISSPQNIKANDYSMTEQYGLFLAMDALIKFDIMVHDIDLIDEYVTQIRRICKRFNTYQEITYGIHTVLGQLISVKLKLVDSKSRENKTKILEYIYDKYIVNGYCFHGFNSVNKKISTIHELKPQNHKKYDEKLGQVESIFRNHGFTNVITKRINNISPSLNLTDSPASAYYYSLATPAYFSNFVATSSYMKNEKKYDRSAFYRKDFNACKKNVLTLCKEARLSTSEQAIVLNIFCDHWNEFHINTSSSCVAYIKRSAIGRNYLKDYKQIIDHCSNRDLASSILLITDNKYVDDKRYTPLVESEISIKKMPTYHDLFGLEEEGFVEEMKEEPIVEPVVVTRYSTVNSYGHADIVALIGVLLIALGSTITILFAIYR